MAAPEAVAILVRAAADVSQMSRCHSSLLLAPIVAMRPAGTTGDAAPGCLQGLLPARSRRPEPRPSELQLRGWRWRGKRRTRKGNRRQRRRRGRRRPFRQRQRPRGRRQYRRMSGSSWETRSRSNCNADGFTCTKSMEDGCDAPSLTWWAEEAAESLIICVWALRAAAARTRDSAPLWHCPR